MSDPERSHIGNYRLIRQLAAGGMGAVFEAEDPRLHRRVALKTLPKDVVGDLEQMRRLEREAQTLASLSHPNIVTIYSVEEDDGIVFLTMEWIDGLPLSKAIPEDGLKLDTFFHFALQIADALEAAHRRDVIHRDIKPGNIMVGPDNRIKVLDFGLAKRSDPEPEHSGESETLTREGQMLGTLPYMSPEQLQGGAVDSRSDIFSFGIVLYEMATGRRPFQGGSWGDLASSILRDEPPSVTDLRIHLPRHLGRILRHCLEKDVKRRFQTVLDLRNELAELQREIVTGELPTGEMTRRPGATKLGRALIGTLIVAAAAALGYPALAPYLKGPDALQGPSRTGPKTIAISQFQNLGPPEEEYFAAGVTDEITSHLAGVNSLRVVSLRTSGDAPNADYLLTGTVRWNQGNTPDAAPRVRVTPRLIRVADGAHLWSQSYEQVINDMFEVQTEIATEVIRQMDIVLLEPERRAMEARPTESPEAFRAYLQGMDLAGRRDPSADHWEQAIERFETATRLDPQFAQAWAELSEIHSFVYHQRRGLRTEDRLAEALRTAERALAIAPDLAQGHRALGYYYYWGHHDFESAMAAFERAEQGLPNDGQVLGGIAYVKRRQGKFDEAADYLQRALESDPESSWLATETAITLLTMRRYLEADRYFARALELAPAESTVYRRRARNYILWHGDLESARATLEAMPEQSTSGAIVAWYELEILAGNPRRARDFLGRTSVPSFGTNGVVWPRIYLEGAARRYEGSTRVSRTQVELALLPLRSRLADSPDDYRIHATMALCYADLDDRENAMSHARRAIELMPLRRDALDGAVMQTVLAGTLTRLGDLDDAVEVLDGLLRVPAEISVPLLRLDPQWKPLQGHPAFEALLEKHSSPVISGGGLPPGAGSPSAGNGGRGAAPSPPPPQT